MSSSDKAHDFAIMLTNYYLNNPASAQSEFPNITPRADNLVYDPYCIYKYIYNQVVNYFNEDFKD